MDPSEDNPSPAPPKRAVLTPLEARSENLSRADSGIVGELLRRNGSGGHPSISRANTLDLDDNNGPSSFWVACSEGSVKRVEELLKSGANMEEIDAFTGLTPLGIACQQGHLPVMTTLLNAKANIEARNPATGTTPLFAALEGAQVEVVEALLAAGADANATDSFKWTPLHAAAEKGLLEPVKLLLSNGADVAAADSGSKTAVQVASKHGHEAVVHILLDAGAKYPPGIKGGLFVESWLLEQPDTAESRAECSRRLHGIVMYDGVSMQRIASLPLVRDAVRDILQQHRPASLIVLDGIVLVVLAAMYIRTSWAVQHEGDLTSTDIRILIVMMVCAVYILLREATQSYVMSQIGELTTQASSIWNWIDLASAFAAVALGIMAVSGEGVRLSATFRLVAAFGAFPIWAKFLGYIKALNLKFATFVMAFFQIARDLRSFVIILLVILLAFANVLFIVIHPRTDSTFGDDEAEEPFKSVQETILTSYRMLLGDFEREWFSTPDDEASRKVAILVFVLYLFIMNVLLLNVLIAVVSDSYDYSMTRSFGLYNRARLELAVELQAVFSLAAASDDEKSQLGDALSILISNRIMDTIGSDRMQRLLDTRPYTGGALVLLLGTGFFCIISPVVLLDLSTWLFLALTSYNPAIADVDHDDEWQGRAVDMENRVRKVLTTGQTLDDRLTNLESALNERMIQVESDFTERLRSTRESLEHKVLDVHAKMNDKIATLGLSLDSSIVANQEQRTKALAEMETRMARHFDDTDANLAVAVERSNAAVEQKLITVQDEVLSKVAALEATIDSQVISKLDELVHRDFAK